MRGHVIGYVYYDERGYVIGYVYERTLLGMCMRADM